MGELMDEGADAVRTCTCPLIGAGVIVELHAVEHHRIAVGLCYVPGMRPYAFSRTAGSFAAPREKDEDIVYHAVSITVILGEISIRIYFPAGLDHHSVSIYVFSGEGGIAAVKTTVVIKPYRTHDIKLRNELTRGVFHKIVAG